jgi:predicted DNA-binding ribbon-helix-helix protein
MLPARFLGGERAVKSPVIKYSVSIDGRFWSSSKEIASERDKSLSQLIASINAKRQFANLSSVLRLFVLEYYTERVGPLERQEIPVAKRRKRHLPK